MFFSTTDLCLDINRHSCEKNWTHTPSASVPYTGWQADTGGFQIFYNSLQVKQFRFLLYLISLQIRDGTILNNNYREKAIFDQTILLSAEYSVK